MEAFCISKAESWKKACTDNPSLFMRVYVFVCVCLEKKEKSFASKSKWSKKGIVFKCEVCEIA